MAGKKYIFIGTLFLFVISIPAHADITIGVHPFKPAEKLIDSFTPLANYLSAKLNEPVQIKISKDYAAHIDGIGHDTMDIAYMGPAPYIKLVKKHGRKPLLARQSIGDKPVFHGKIFVRNDSKIHTLAELAGKRFAFGEPHSTMSHLVPRYMLWQAGITVDKLSGFKFVGDHVNVALGVLSGDYDAGAVKEDVYYKYQSRGLRDIATSEPISDHLFVARSTMPIDKVNRIREILLKSNEDPAGLKALESMTHGVIALVPVTDHDYDTLRVALDKLSSIGVTD